MSFRFSLGFLDICHWQYYYIGSLKTTVMPGELLHCMGYWKSLSALVSVEEVEIIYTGNTVKADGILTGSSDSWAFPPW